MPEPELPEQPPVSPRNKHRLIVIAATLIVGIALLSFLAYLYLKPHSAPPTSQTQTATPSAQTSTTSSTPKPPTHTPDPTASWTAYASTAGHFTLKFPPAWKTKVCPDNPQTLFLAPKTAALGACQSDFGGQMQVTSIGGDQRASYKYTVASYDTVVTTTVTVSAVTGERQSAIAKGGEALGPPAGTKLVQYLFFTGGRTYLATYQQQPSGDVSEDVTSDFDLMIQNTLQFT